MRDVFQNIPPEAVFGWIRKEYELVLIDEWVTHSEEGQPVPPSVGARPPVPWANLIDVVITAIARARKHVRLHRTSETHAECVHAANCWIDERRVQKQLAKIALELENAQEVRYALERRQNFFTLKMNRKRLHENRRTKTKAFTAFRKQVKTAAKVVNSWGRFVHDKLFDVRHSDEKVLAFWKGREDPDNAVLCCPALHGMPRWTGDIYHEVYGDYDDDPNGERLVD